MRTRRLLLTVVSLLVAAGLMVGLLLLVNAESGFSGCTGTTAYGWMALLLAASIIGGLAWVLLGQESGSDRPGSSAAVPCPSCGGDVLCEWRLCPHCGVMLDLTPTSNTSDPAPQR